MGENFHTLKCNNCGAVYDREKLITRICTQCAHVATLPPLTDGSFEKAVEGEEINKPDSPPKKEAEEKTIDRPDEEGGRVF